MADEQSTPDPSKPKPMTRERAIELLKTDVPAWNEWRQENLEEVLPSLANADLRGAHLVEANLDEVHLEGAKLIGAHLERAKLQFAHLEGANLYKANLEGAKPWFAHLEGANLRQAHLEGAELLDAHLEGACLLYACLKGAKLYGAYLEGADLRGADFSNVNVTGVTYDRRKGKFRGIHVATCYGHALFIRDARDQDYIETRLGSLDDNWHSWKQRKEQQRKDLDAERRQPSGRSSWSWMRKRIAAWIVTSPEWLHLVGQCVCMRLWFWIDYGRSLWRVAAFALWWAMLFGSIFHVWGGMLKCKPEIAESWLTPYYYSIVTYTTLGFGDVTPVTPTGQVIVIVEVILGYFTLGLLVSILANKVARRA